MMVPASGLHVVRGDAVAALQRGGINILGHQVNLRGVMGAGIAHQIKDVFPTASAAYSEAIASGDLALGDVQFVRVGEGRWVANMVGQQDIGRGRRQTDYQALSAALRKLADLTEGTTLRVGLPFGIGCGLAGGDWSVVSRAIEETVPQAVLYRL